MAESPRTAQNVDYIMENLEDIHYYLKTLVERENDVEIKKTQREILIAIYRLTAAIEGLNSTYRAIHKELTENVTGQVSAGVPS